MKRSPIYSSAISLKGFLALDLWKKFQMVELTDIIRQRGDCEFIRVLNKIREENIDEDLERTLKPRFFKKTLQPEHVVHMFAENTSQKA